MASPRQHTRTRFLPLSALLAFGSACSIVDDSLYRNLESAQGGSGGDSSMQPVLAEECERNTDYFPLDGDGQVLSLDTRELRDDVNRESGLTCTGGDTPGNDGFFAIQVEAGDTWHFHLSPNRGFLEDEEVDLNPVLYVLDETCTIRNCPRGHDICQNNINEHFTYAATDTGTIFLGVDDRLDGGGLYEFEAIKLECGNGTRQHGKACELGDENCDDECRSLLDPNNPVETSVSHAEFKSANVVQFRDGASSVRIRGVLAGCEPDIYLVDVAEGQGLVVELLQNDANPCEPTAPPIELELFDGRERLLDEGSTGEENGCPSLATDALDAGRYFLKLSNAPSEDEIVTFEYRFHVESVEP